MSDALETLLKEAVKKIVAEALAETMQEQAAMAGKSVAQHRLPSPSKIKKMSILRERFDISLTSIGGAAFALALCGVVTTGLFAPELAQASVGGYQKQYRQENAAVISSAPDVDYSSLANLDNVEEMVKQGALFYATPEDLAAIVFFHGMRKMARGEPLRVEELEAEFKDSLPDQWVPVYQAVKVEFPEQQPLPPIPMWFDPVIF